MINEMYRNEKNVTAPERIPRIKSGLRYLLRPIVHSINVLKLYIRLSVEDLVVILKVEERKKKKLKLRRIECR